MREPKNLRKYTRSTVWDDIRAILSMKDPFGSSKRNVLTIEGTVRDIGAHGMFFISDENIPVGTKADIVIDFDPGQPGKLSLKAQGEIVRTGTGGVGVIFLNINLQRLQECIMGRMNRS